MTSTSDKRWLLVAIEFLSWGSFDIGLVMGALIGSAVGNLRVVAITVILYMFTIFVLLRPLRKWARSQLL